MQPYLSFFLSSFHCSHCAVVPVLARGFVRVRLQTCFHSYGCLKRPLLEFGQRRYGCSVYFFSFFIALLLSGKELSKWVRRYDGAADRFNAPYGEVSHPVNWDVAGAVRCFFSSPPNLFFFFEVFYYFILADSCHTFRFVMGEC